MLWCATCVCVNNIYLWKPWGLLVDSQIQGSWWLYDDDNSLSLLVDPSTVLFFLLNLSFLFFFAVIFLA